MKIGPKSEMEPDRQDHTYCIPTYNKTEEVFLQNSRVVCGQLATEVIQHSYCQPLQITENKKQQHDGISKLLAQTKTSEPQGDPLALAETNEQQVETDPLAQIETNEQQKIRVYGPAPHATTVKLKKIKKPPQVENFNPILIRSVINPKQLQNNLVNARLQQDRQDKTTADTLFMSPNISISEKQIQLMNIGLPPPPPLQQMGRKPITSRPPPKLVLEQITSRPPPKLVIEQRIAPSPLKVIDLPTTQQITKIPDKTPQVRYLLKQVGRNKKIIKSLRKNMKDLRKQAKLINGIKSPALKTLIFVAATNEKRKPQAKRWPDSLKEVALNILKKSSRAAYKYISEVFLLPNLKSLQKIDNIEKGSLPSVKPSKQDMLCDLLLKRIDKMTENFVDDTRVPLNMKILIKGDRKVGKSCLLQRLQGGPFIEEYVPSEQTQLTPIHWTHKNSDHNVKVEVWEVVDKGRDKKKLPLSLKLENQTPWAVNDGANTSTNNLNFYKDASGVILMMDITKPRTFEYVVKELSQVPSELPVVILGNHCDMQHHRQVHPHHIDQALHQAKLNRSGPVRYAESSMCNGFGLRLLHKFLSVPFLQLQRASLLEQLQRCQRDAEDMEREIDDFQNSEEAHYEVFLERLASKRREEAQRKAAEEARLASERLVSEQTPNVRDEGDPVVPPTAPAQSLKPKPKKRKAAITTKQKTNKKFIYPELLKPNTTVSTPSGLVGQHSGAGAAAAAALDGLYAGTMDSRFLDDLGVASNKEQTYFYSDAENPDLDDNFPVHRVESTRSNVLPAHRISNEGLNKRLKSNLNLSKADQVKKRTNFKGGKELAASPIQSTLSMPSLDNDLTHWVGDSSARTSEGGASPNVAVKVEKKPKKPKDKDACSQKSARTDLKRLTCVNQSSITLSDLPERGKPFGSFEQYEF